MGPDSMEGGPNPYTAIMRIHQPTGSTGRRSIGVATNFDRLILFFSLNPEMAVYKSNASSVPLSVCRLTVAHSHVIIGFGAEPPVQSGKQD